MTTVRFYRLHDPLTLEPTDQIVAVPDRVRVVLDTDLGKGVAVSRAIDFGMAIEEDVRARIDAGERPDVKTRPGNYKVKAGSKIDLPVWGGRGVKNGYTMVGPPTEPPR